MILKNLFRWVVIILLVFSIYFSAVGYIDKAIDIIGMGDVAASNDEYLEQSFDKAVNGFLILSGIKSGLAVIEGSEVGVGFNLELGDLVQSVYDYVDIAWKTALAGGTIVLLTRLLLQAADMVDHWFLSTLLFFLLISLMIKWFLPKFLKFSSLLKEIYFFLIIFTIVLYIVLPFSITCSAFLSEKITRPLIQESQSSFESIKDEFSIDEISERIFAEEQTADEDGTWLSKLNIKAKLDRVGKNIKELANYFKEKTKNIAIWTIQLIAGYLFDSIIFPITFFIFLFIITKSVLLFLFEKRKNQTMVEDFSNLIIKYYGRVNKKEPVKKKYRMKPMRKIRHFPPGR